MSAMHRSSRMAAQIVQIDLAHPLPAVRAEPRYTGLWILVRYGPRPIGWVRVRTKPSGETIAPDALAQLVAETLWREVRDVVWHRKPELQPLPRRTPLISIVICTRGAASGDRGQGLERQ